ncbi:hypothetical protein BJF83_02530 [Nocardiopsis sp. CNR-923]|uniref:hypothetical protein n=1 Tax=Nocardiopsis sp. CNR-923 TaxID=1904965 RepID=UPI0009634AF8|nr:hypothetical protein [Nocardiopsis sp. CNR-923]OLT27441.1 hypothetical protein BJF83_02530 [Nocardiopsis sp. CNR-923]
MTSPTENDPFENQLRSILRSEADTVEPSAEALNLIRERTERGRGWAWFGLPWLRPVLAVAGAVLIAASVVVSSPEFRDHVLEIVPAGADRAGTPQSSEPSGDDVATIAPTPDAGGDVAAPVPEPTDDPTPATVPSTAPSSSPDDVEASATCGPVPASPTERESPDTGEGASTPSDDECPAPDDEPTDEDSGSGTGGTGGRDEDPGEDDGPDGSGNSGQSPGDSAGGSDSTTAPVESALR